MYATTIALQAIQKHREDVLRTVKANPGATVLANTYLAHVDRLLIELDQAHHINILQASNIRDTLERLQRQHPQIFEEETDKNGASPDKEHSSRNEVLPDVRQNNTAQRIG